MGKEGTLQDKCVLICYQLENDYFGEDEYLMQNIAPLKEICGRIKQPSALKELAHEAVSLKERLEEGELASYILRLYGEEKLMIIRSKVNSLVSITL